MCGGNSNGTFMLLFVWVGSIYKQLGTVIANGTSEFMDCGIYPGR